MGCLIIANSNMFDYHNLIKLSNSSKIINLHLHKLCFCFKSYISKLKNNFSSEIKWRKQNDNQSDIKSVQNAVQTFYIKQFKCKNWPKKVHKDQINFEKVHIIQNQFILCMLLQLVPLLIQFFWTFFRTTISQSV